MIYSCLFLTFLPFCTLRFHFVQPSADESLFCFCYVKYESLLQNVWYNIPKYNILQKCIFISRCKSRPVIPALQQDAPTTSMKSWSANGLYEDCQNHISSSCLGNIQAATGIKPNDTNHRLMYNSTNSIRSKQEQTPMHIRTPNNYWGKSKI